MSLTLIIPAYNEEEGVGAVVRQARNVLPEAEVIVVDDGSTDRTAACAEVEGARVIRHPATAGYGRSLKTGIRAARHEQIAIADADGTYPVEEIPLLLAKLGEGFDMVVGARQGRHYRGTFLKPPARAIFRFLVEFSTGVRIPDINSGLRVFRKSDVESLFPLLCDTFSFTTTLTLAYCFLHRFIAYVPIPYAPRVGRSKVRPVRDTLRTLQFLVESIAYFNPLKLFLLLALALLLLAVICVAAWWWLGQSHLALPGSIFLSAAVITFGCGLHAYVVARRGSV